MTLQYRIRSRYHDERWRKRIRLCNELILQTTDMWCRDDADYPTQQVVARILYLFSPRCEPNNLSNPHLLKRLKEIVGAPTHEYESTWPKRPRSAAQELIHSLITILDDAVHAWTDGGLHDPVIETVVQQIVDEIVGRQYVIFHHKETTRRDNNHWGIG